MLALSPAAKAASPGEALLAEVNLVLSQTAAQSDSARLDTIGTSFGGRHIKAVTFSREQRKPSTGVRVLIMCGQHGNETAPIRAVLECLRSWSVSEHKLGDAEVVVVPVVNPDGLVSGRRLNAANADLNRDWASPKQPETTAVMSLVDKFRPHVAIDLHEWTDSDSCRQNCIEIAGSGNTANVALADAIAERALRRAKSHRFPLAKVFYSPASDSRLAHRKLTADGVCGLLVETSPRHCDSDRRQAYEYIIQSVIDETSQPSDPQVAAVVSRLVAQCPKASQWPPNAVGQNVNKLSDSGSRACWTMLTAFAIWVVGFASVPKRNRCAGVKLPGRMSKLHTATGADAEPSEVSIATKLAAIRSRSRSASDPHINDLALVLSDR